MQDGFDAPVDKTEAAHLYKMLSDNGNDEAKWKYAGMLNNGEGVQENKEEAAQLYETAIANGNQNAINGYVNMLSRSDSIDDKMKAEHLLNMDVDKEANI